MKEAVSYKKPDQDDKIDLIELARTIWFYKKQIIIITLVFSFLGLVFAKISEKKFKAQSTFIPQVGDNDRLGSNLGGIASLAGINLGGMSRGNEIPPSLYPQFVSSVRFKKSLLNAMIQPEGLDTPVTYAYYYENIYKPNLLSSISSTIFGFPGKVIGWIRPAKVSAVEYHYTSEQNLIKLTEEEVKHFSRIDKQISIQPKDKEGIVELSFSMPEPLMSAQMALFTEQLLQKELINYKIQSAREQLNYTEERFLEKKSEFEAIQNRLAVFRDRNQNISSAIAMNQLDRMEAEYNFSFSIYTELAKQLEQAKLQVNKDTPIFVVINPVTIPSIPYAPNRLVLLIIFTFIGLFASLAYVFVSDFVKDFKSKNQN